MPCEVAILYAPSLASIDARRCIMADPRVQAASAAPAPSSRQVRSRSMQFHASGGLKHQMHGWVCERSVGEGGGGEGRTYSLTDDGVRSIS